MNATESVRTAISVERIKFSAAALPRIATLMLVVGVTTMCASFLLATLQPDSPMALKVGSLVREGGWAGLFGMASQIVAVGGMLAFGVVLAWLFGREFADGTIAGLFALPVSRCSIATAKLTVFAVWVLVAATALVVALVIAGMTLGFGAPSPQVTEHAGKLFLITVMTAGLALPAGVAATIWRGYLGGVGAVVALVVLAQVCAVSGVGGWVPPAAPGLWAGSNGADAAEQVSVVQLGLVIPFTVGFALLTLHRWRRLQLVP